MRRTRIKCCGITRPGDAVLAAQLGADAIGLVFTRRSKRFVDVPAARAIRAALPPYVVVVALFMDDEVAWVHEVEAQLRPHVLQFHGSEPAAYCQGFVAPHVKAVAMGSAPDLAAEFAAYPQAMGFLLDGHRMREPGGSGKSFDWSQVPRQPERPVVIAGGLTPDNVAEAVQIARPWAVDVSSGIESAPGIKDADLMHRFIAAVHEADAQA